MDCLSAQSPFSLRKLCVWLVVHENILFYHARRLHFVFLHNFPDFSRDQYSCLF